LIRVLSQSALLLGFAIGGLALAAVGARTLLVVDALSFVASAALLRWGTSEHPARATGARPPISDGLRATRDMLREPVLRRLLLLTWIPSALFCSVDAMATPYAGGRGQDVGLLLAAAALGLIAAEWLAIRIGLASRPRLVLPVALITGFALIGYAGHPAVQVAAVLNLVAALGGAVGQWVDKSLVDHLDEHVRGRLFAMQGGLLMAVQGIGIAVAGAMAEFVSPHQVLAGAGLLCLIVSYVLLRDVRSPREGRLATSELTADA
jgi:hypothetical protein